MYKSHKTKKIRLLRIRHSIGRASDVEYSTFDGRLIESKKTQIRESAHRMSDIRHSTDGRSNRKNLIQQIRRIEFATFEPTERTRLIWILIV